MKLLLFDVDQTLISTGGAGIRSLNRAFRKILSMENAMDGISVHGKTDPSIIREVINARLGEGAAITDSLEAVLDAYVFFLAEEVLLSPTYRVLPGIAEILQEMTSRRDVMLGLATGNVERGARIKLDRGNLNRYFSFGGFGSDSESRVALVLRAVELAAEKHGSAIDPQKIFVIGDTPRDIEAGRQAGFRTVGVATGGYAVDQLRECGAWIAISDFAAGRAEFLQKTGTGHPKMGTGH